MCWQQTYHVFLSDTQVLGRICPHFSGNMASSGSPNEVEGNVRLQIIATDKKVLFDMTYVSQS